MLFSHRESVRSLRHVAGLLITKAALLLLAACATTKSEMPSKTAAMSARIDPAYVCPANEKSGEIVRAYVVAMEQSYDYNRYGARNSNGLIYALRRDVVKSEDDDNDVAIPLTESAEDAVLAGEVRLRKAKRARPLVLRVRQGDILEVHFTNLIGTSEESGQRLEDPQNPGHFVPADKEELATRDASFHVNGLELTRENLLNGKIVGGIRGLGVNVGRNPTSTVKPGETIVVRYLAQAEGTYFLHSMADPVGGEGYGGQVGLGLFGAINVEPPCSRWYRSQVSEADMKKATTGQSALDTPIINYDWRAGDKPVLAMLNAQNEIVHSDLNAVIEQPGKAHENCEIVSSGPGNSCGTSFREFTAIFHDEATVDQAFTELEDENDPIHAIRDGMGINYGVSGLGSMVLANRATDVAGKPVYALDESRHCVECKLEEFFLTAWVVGDPAMMFKRDEKRRAVEAKYADDPSNVHHSYMGDPIRFRNIHAGPKETHVFHLHAHQWVRDWTNDRSVYLDSQTISPGSTYTYQIHYGGSGNRNLEVGDSIFHCHLYPHFAQGMWAMWRSHDSFEDGSSGLYNPGKPQNLTNNPRWRNLPDPELAQGSPSPAVVPLPGYALPPMPSAEQPGYPFYIAGRIGHRPPQPPLDLEVANDGGIGRHVVLGGTRALGSDANMAVAKAAVDEKYFDSAKAAQNGLSPASVANAKRVRAANGSRQLLALASKLETANIEVLPADGVAAEKRAMDFHHGKSALFGGLPVNPLPLASTDHQKLKVLGYPSCDAAGNCFSSSPDKPSRLLFAVNSHDAKPGAPYADPCPVDVNKFGFDPNFPLVERTYRAAYVQFDMPVNKYGWHDPQARMIVLEGDIADTLRPANDPLNRPAEPFFFRANSGECVVFKATNLLPSVLNLDDFQVYSPTDTIGQHIHLVKFDVTSSDGSANGWNYEDATFSPDETRERIIAANVYRKAHPGSGALLAPSTHTMFKPGGALYEHPRWRKMGECGTDPKKWNDHPWCGAQTSIQRWWADPLENKDSVDRTIRTVFTHDHLGPSSHQHHGLYAALVVEPKGSRWTTLDGKVTLGGTRNGAQVVTRVDDGGPTSFKANILTDNESKGAREFNLAFADYAILYTKDNKPVSPVNKIESGRLPDLIHFGTIPTPEGISTKDPGSQLVNYRNEPIPLRIGKSSGTSFKQRSDVDADCLTRSLVRFVGTDAAHPERDAAVRLQPSGTPIEVIAAGSSQSNKADIGNVTDAEVLARHTKRLCDKGDMANVFSSRVHGDPATQILEGYQGDRINIRIIQGAQEENHVFTVHGGNWLVQPDIPGSGNVNAQQIGISEHFEFNFKVTSPQAQAPVTDYFYAASATDNLWDGQWGLMRAYAFDKNHEFLARLPNNPATPVDAAANFNFADPLSAICPASESKTVIAARAANILGSKGIVYNNEANLYDPNAIMLFEEKDRGPLKSGSKRAEPLVLRMTAGSCLSVRLVNELPLEMPDGPNVPMSWSHNLLPPIVEGFNFNNFRTSSRISLHTQLVSSNVLRDDGSYVGYNTDSSCAADGSCGGGRLYRWYAGAYDLKIVGGQVKPVLTPVEYGVAAIQDFGDVIKHPSHGAVGALVVEPAGATIATDCDIMPDKSKCSNAAATIAMKNKDGKDESFREFVVVYQDDVSLFQNGVPLANVSGEDDSEDSGQRAFSYHMEPLWARIGGSIGDEPEDLLNYRWQNILSSYRCDGRPISFERPLTGRCLNGNAPAIVEPETLMFTAEPGIYTRMRLVHPGGHPRNHAFTLYGHNWIQNPWSGPEADGLLPSGSRHQLYHNNWSLTRSGIVDGLGPARHFNMLIESAGGAQLVPGDYLYRSQDHMAFYSGQWGIMRVPDTCKTKGNHKLDAEGNVCR